jgi:hypothetical protein
MILRTHTLFKRSLALATTVVLFNSTLVMCELVLVNNSQFDTRFILVVQHLLDSQEVNDTKDSAAQSSGEDSLPDLYHSVATCANAPMDYEHMVLHFNSISGKPLAPLLDMAIQPPESLS